MVLALIELLEYAGCRVELTLIYAGQSHTKTESLITETIKLKSFEQPLSHTRLAFIALHPAAFRRVQFRAYEGLDKEVKEHFGIGAYYTMIADAKLEVVKEYDIYFEKLVPATSTTKFSDKEGCTAYIVEELKKQGVTVT